MAYCKQLSEWLSTQEQQDADAQQKRREMLRIVDKYEDAGYGQCFLRNPGVAGMVQDAMKHLDGKQYSLLEWCIMPNHVHMLVQLAEDTSLSNVMYTLKSYTAKQANKLLHRQGHFWGREYFDRYIRDYEHYKRVVNYIANNPVKACLVDSVEQWPWHGTQGRLLVYWSAALERRRPAGIGYDVVPAGRRRSNLPAPQTNSRQPPWRSTYLRYNRRRRTFCRR